MHDPFPTIWKAEDHTLAKHRILRKYLDAWLPILSRQAHAVQSKNEVLYVDGFAGPGIYEAGEDGSPIIALKAALAHDPFPTPIRFLFIEEDKARVNVLRDTLAKYNGDLTTRSDLIVEEPLHGDCDVLLRKHLDSHHQRGKAFGPALVFLDQFGYGSVAMDLVKRVMAFQQCEVFSYLDATGMQRFVGDPYKWPAITRAFGNNAWEPAKGLSERERSNFLRNLYRKHLKEIGGAKFVWDFAMCGDGDRLLYWLFFCTSNLKGLEVMKKAMWKVDDTGSFRFSDAADPNQLMLLQQHDEEWLAEHLFQRFERATPTVEEVRTHVLVETPCFNFIGALAKLEKDNRLKPVQSPEGRKKGAFGPYPDMKLSFEPPNQGELF